MSYHDLKATDELSVAFLKSVYIKNEEGSALIQLFTPRMVISDHEPGDLEAMHELLSNQAAMVYLEDIRTNSIEASRKNLTSALPGTLDTVELDLDVLCWNETGKSFWKSLGFKERSLSMRLDIRNQGVPAKDC